MHIISVDMSALHQYQVADKQECSDKRDYMIIKFPKSPNIYLLTGEL
jgi:hypothetical protein